MLKRAFLLTVAILAAILAGCVSAPPPTAEPVSPLSVPTKVNTGTTAASPLPSPTLTTFATPKAGTGNVTGLAYRFDGTPMRGITVYAALIEDRGGTRLSAVDPLLDPHATTDSEGRFVLLDLKPGEYAIATQSPVGIIMPRNPKGEIVLYKVKADEQVNLGHLELGYTYPDS